MISIARLLLVIILLFSLGNATANISKQRGHIRVTLEELTLPGDEKMGLLGGNYLLDLGSSFYGGIGVYGAVTGKRGGFFTGGFEFGKRKKINKDWSLDVGMFIGGGGGGAAPQGGGLMLRPHAGVIYNTRFGRFGANISKVKFPNGAIDSTQFSLSYEKPFNTLLGKGWASEKRFWGSLRNLDRDTALPPGQDFSVITKNYLLPKGTLNTGGLVQDEDMKVIGIEWDGYVDKNAYLKLEAGGALGGNSDGFAQILFGGGYRTRVMGNNDIFAEAAIGAAGGGSVDTGGGVITDVALGIKHRFSNGIFIGLKAGHMDAHDGNFKATTLTFNLGYGENEPDRIPGKGVKVRSYKPRYWRLRSVHQSYLPIGDTRRKGQSTPDDRNVHQVGLQIDAFVQEHTYLTGQAYGAYKGGAGGYAAGQVGIGYLRPWWKHSRLLLNAEALIGAGGGGGLAVGDGLIYNAKVGVGYRLNKLFDLNLSLGRLKAPDGTFEANTVDLSIGYRFTSMGRR
jgi:hypothetical protein